MQEADYDRREVGTQVARGRMKRGRSPHLSPTATTKINAELMGLNIYWALKIRRIFFGYSAQVAHSL